MKKWLLLGLLILPCMVSFGRNENFSKKLLTTTPAKLRLFVDQKTDPYTIKVAYTLNIPPNYIPSCARLVYQPYFLAADHRYDLTPLIISGRRNRREERRLQDLAGKQPEYPNAIHLEATRDGMKIKLSEIVPFQVWMAQSKLRADVILESCDREQHLEVLTLAEGVIWFPMGPGPVRVKYVKEKAEVPETSSFDFIYPTGRTGFEREYKGNARQMQAMMRLMDSLRDNPEMKLEKVVITGYSSPSGSLAINEKLARERALQMKQRFTQRRGLEAGQIEIRTVAEDWQGLKEWVSKTSDFPDRMQILRILDGNYTDKEKENLLQKSSSYGYIRQRIFPELQKVSCRFYYTRVKEVTRVVPL